ncbi:cytochrome P450 [Infundibulicybe gibba]|nr:cytochrome P450 [Infundibulicybe gibba]
MASFQFAVLLTFVLALVFRLGVVIYRLYFHQLRRFPGPKGFYDIVKHGNFLQQLERLHRQYGPVVRIGPNHLHFTESSAFLDIYSSRSTFSKDPEFCRGFGVEQSSFGLIDPKQARIRRELLSPFFSRRAILKFEQVVQTEVTIFVHRPADMFYAFRCLSIDVMTSYCFAQTLRALDSHDFHHPIILNIEGRIPTAWILRYFPSITSLMKTLPDYIILYFAPGLQDFVALRYQMSTQINNFLADIPSKESLLDEALALLQAGSETVAHACLLGSFYGLKDPKVKAKLIQELRDAWPDRFFAFSFESLEKLPYFTAFIKECLRMSYGAATPMQGVVPSDATIGGYRVPAGTIVAFGATFMHDDPKVFLEPEIFIPERWLGQNRRELETYFVPFSRGPRMCLGQTFSLARCELYLIFGNLFRKLDMTIHNTSYEDFHKSNMKDFFVPVYTGRHLYLFIKDAPQ